MHLPNNVNIHHPHRHNHLNRVVLPPSRKYDSSRSSLHARVPYLTEFLCQDYHMDGRFLSKPNDKSMPYDDNLVLVSLSFSPADKLEKALNAVDNGFLHKWPNSAYNIWK